MAIGFSHSTCLPAESVEGGLHVHVVGRADRDGVDLVDLQQLLVIVKGEGNVPLFARRHGAALGQDVGHGEDLALIADAAVARRVRPGCDPAEADDADADLAVFGHGRMGLL
jgi:hypothetical protein